MRTPVLSIFCAALGLLFVLAPGGVEKARAGAPPQVMPVQDATAHRGPIWETKAVSVRYGVGRQGDDRTRVVVVVRFKNISPLPAPAMNISGYRFTLNGQYPYQHSRLDFNRVGMVRPNGEILVSVVTDNVSPEEQARFRALEVKEPVTTERLRNPIMWFFPLPPATAPAPAPPTPPSSSPQPLLPSLPRASSSPQPQPSSTYIMGGPVQVGPWQVRATNAQVRAEGVTVTLALRNLNQAPQSFAVRDVSGVITLANGSKVENLKPLHEVNSDRSSHNVASNQEDTMSLFFPIRDPLLRQRLSTMNIVIVRKPTNLPLGFGELYLPDASPEPRPVTEFRRLNSSWSVRLDQVRPYNVDTLAWVTFRNDSNSTITLRDSFDGVFSSSSGDQNATLIGADGMNGFDGGDNRGEAPIVVRRGEMASFTFRDSGSSARPRPSRLRISHRVLPGAPATGEVDFEMSGGSPNPPPASPPAPAPAPEPTPPPPPSTTPAPAPVPNPAPPPPPPPARSYGPPADPAPNPGAEQAMRALEGVWTTNLETPLALRYEGGLMRGQLRAAEGQPATGTMTLALNAQGRLVGVMQRAGQSAETTWFAVDLTPSFDRSRLEGSAAYVHRPTNSPMPFSARRESPPQPAPSPTPQGGSDGVAGAGDYRPTAYLDMKVERVGRTADGSVEVTLAARNSSGERKGVQHDTQRFALVGSDGFEYGWDGNYYGQSGAEHLNATIWLQPRAQSRVTYVFPRVPADVTAARLILRENGAQTVVFELPR